jgi:hypothetical protein
MSDTEKIRENKNTNRVLEVVRRDDGTFNLFLNREIDRSRIPEERLSHEVCARRGFCGEEYELILRELEEHGRTTLALSSGNPW